MPSKEQTRFDTRLSKEQKAYFERAANLGGYKTLSEFILSSARSQADRIMERHNQILSSAADRDVFFKAILKPAQPNARLKAAARKYNEALKRG